MTHQKSVASEKKPVQWKWAGVAVLGLVLFVAAIWRLTMGHDVTHPTAHVLAGATPVYRGSGEPLDQKTPHLPPLPPHP